MYCVFIIRSYWKVICPEVVWFSLSNLHIQFIWEGFFCVMWDKHQNSLFLSVTLQFIQYLLLKISSFVTVLQCYLSYNLCKHVSVGLFLNSLFSFTGLGFYTLFFFKLYNIALVLPNIEINPPQVYMCSPSWTLLPPPSSLPIPSQFRKMVTITLYTRQQKRHWCIEQSFGLCGRGRG